MGVSEKLGGKVPVVDDVSHPRNRENYPTTSLDEVRIEFDFQTDRSYYVDLRQKYLALKLKFVKGCGYEIHNRNEIKKENKEEENANESMEEEGEASVPLLTLVNNFLHSFFLNIEVYINNQQIYNPNKLYAHNSYLSNNFRAANSEHNG